MENTELLNNADGELGSAYKSLETLFASPAFWKGGKVCDFFNKAHNSIKDSLSYKGFKTKLDQEALTPKWNLWNPYKNWKEILGDEHFDLVTTYLRNEKKSEQLETVELKKRNVKVEIYSVVSLLGVIRNKHEHNTLYKNEEKRKLNWFRECDGSFQFDNQLYANYWVQKFPNLGFFLWYHFCGIKEVELEPFYPNIHKSVESINPSDIFESVNQKLVRQTKEGFLEDRYDLHSERTNKCCLEFRSLPEDLIGMLLQSSCCLEVTFNNERIRCCWYDRFSEVCSEYKQSCKNTSCMKVIVVGTLENFNQIRDLEKQIQEIHNFDRIVIFCNQSSIGSTQEKCSRNNLLDTLKKELKCRFSQYPIRWSDLGSSCQEAVKRSTKFLIQDKIVTLMELLPDVENSQEENNILLSLSGETLNAILRNKVPTILHKQTIPNVPKIYMERKIYKRIVVNSQILDCGSMADICVASNISHRALAKMQNCKEIDIQVLNDKHLSENLNAKIFLYTNEFYDLREACRKLNETRATNLPYNIHCFRYLKDDLFQWIGTYGNTSLLEQFVLNFQQESQLASEADILESFHGFRESEKLIFIADSPGMGKSLILSSLANKLVTQPNCLVICFSVNQFSSLTDGNLILENAESIISFFGKILGDTYFEQNLVQYWFKCREANWKVDLFLDGLDEVPQEKLQHAIDILKHIRQQVPHIRIWITLRDHMLDLICTQFNSFGYKIEPFSMENQIWFLESLWLQYVSRFSNEEDNLSSTELQNFAKLCLNNPFTSQEVTITGIPLQCRMVAEINERKVLNRDFTINENSCNTLTELYAQIIDRKLEIYMKEKYKLLNIDACSHMVNLAKDDMYRTHTYFAMKLIFPESVCKEFQTHLLIGPYDIEQHEAVVLEQGIIQSINPLTFVHRTFAEYFIAHFVWKVAMEQNIHISPTDFTFEKFLWDHAMAVVISKSDDFRIPQNCEFRNPTICHFLNYLMQENAKLPALLSSADIMFEQEVKRSPRIAAQLCTKAPLFIAAYKSNCINLIDLFFKYQKETLGFFISCISSGQFRIVKSLVEQHVMFQPKNWYKVQEFDKTGYSILHWVLLPFIEHYTTGSTPLLLRYFGSIDPSLVEIRDNNGCTPLMFLARADVGMGVPTFEEYLNILIRDLKANVNVRYSNDDTLLHMVWVSNRKGKYASWDASSLAYQYETLWRVLLENGCQFINAKNQQGLTPIQSAVCLVKGQISGALDILKKYGANLDVKFLDGRTVLHKAIEEDFDFHFIMNLVRNGGDVLAKNNEGQSALHLAVATKHDYSVTWFAHLLTDYLDVKDKQGKTVLDYDGNIIHTFLRGLQNFLIVPFWDPKQFLWKEYKQFLTAVVKRKPLLLEQRNDKGQSPLKFWLDGGSDCFTYRSSWFVFDIAMYFAKNLEASLVPIDNNGNTILHFTNRPTQRHRTYTAFPYVLRHILRNILTLFVNQASNKRIINAVNNSGQTPLHLLIEVFAEQGIDFSNILDLLRKCRTNFNAPDKDGNSPLLLLIKNDMPTNLIRNVIFKCKANVNFKNTKGQSALHIAAKQGNLEIVKLLVNECNVRPNALEGEEKSVLTYAGTKQVYDFLTGHIK